MTNYVVHPSNVFTFLPSFMFPKQSSLARNAGAHLNDNEIEDFYDQNDNRDEGVERNHDEDKLNECEANDEYE